MQEEKSPYSTGLASDGINSSLPTRNQERKYKVEWDKRKGQKRLPHEIEHLPSILATIVDDAVQSAKIIDAFVAKEGKDAELLELQGKLEEIADFLIKRGDNILVKKSF